MNMELERMISEIENTAAIGDLDTFQNIIMEAINLQRKKIEELNEMVTVIRYNHYSKKIEVERGINAEYTIKGAFTSSFEKIEEVDCPRTNTKKFNKLVGDLKQKHNAVICESTEKLLAKQIA